MAPSRNGLWSSRCWASGALPGDPLRGGRPRSAAPAPGWVDEQTLRTSAGITLRRGRDSRGLVLHLSGPGLSQDLMDSLMVAIQSLLER